MMSPVFRSRVSALLSGLPRMTQLPELGLRSPNNKSPTGPHPLEHLLARLLKRRRRSTPMSSPRSLLCSISGPGCHLLSTHPILCHSVYQPPQPASRPQAKRYQGLLPVPLAPHPLCLSGQLYLPNIPCTVIDGCGPVISHLKLTMYPWGLPPSHVGSSSPFSANMEQWDYYKSQTRFAPFLPESFCGSPLPSEQSSRPFGLAFKVLCAATCQPPQFQLLWLCPYKLDLHQRICLPPNLALVLLGALWTSRPPGSFLQPPYNRPYKLYKTN
ncbi:uncharacterized protein NDUFV1-DT [Gorilla gorilla gorilla]|uniref:uncharacterized protein NDUFV1-DT n=1 Tax=Gorilla gorilla gorilla TaxID=9595 RepID=UPI0024464191|nr:uncharacterized protein NDUFV1-DT [Gorilla gorilla gorilla]